MQHVPLGRTGLKVSPLCLGTMMFGGPTDPAESTRIIHRALDAVVDIAIDRSAKRRAEEAVP